MADRGHKADLPDEQAVTAFVRALRPTADAMARDTGLSFSTVQKWYRHTRPIQPSAASLLRVIVALGAEPLLVQHVAEWRATSNGVSYDRPGAPPLPTTALRRVAEAEPDSGEKKKRR